MSASDILSGGFSDPVFESQSVFRAVLNAFAGPGAVVPVPSGIVPPEGFHMAAAALVLALADGDTPVWFDSGFSGSDAGEWLAFQTGAPLTDRPDQAAFAIIADHSGLSAPDVFAPGSEEYPDRSSTVIVQIDGFDGAGALVVEGPGIPGERVFRPDPLPSSLIGLLEANRTLYPRGIDLVLAAPDALVALPRSMRVRAA